MKYRHFKNSTFHKCFIRKGLDIAHVICFSNFRLYSQKLILYNTYVNKNIHALIEHNLLLLLGQKNLTAGVDKQLKVCFTNFMGQLVVFISFSKSSENILKKLLTSSSFCAFGYENIFSKKWFTSCLFCALHFLRYSSKKFLTFWSRFGMKLRLSVLFIQLFLSDLFYISRPIRKVLYLTLLRQIQDLLFLFTDFKAHHHCDVFPLVFTKISTVSLAIGFCHLIGYR